MKTKREIKDMFSMLGRLKAQRDASKDTFEMARLTRKIKKLSSDIEKETGIKP